MSGWGLEMTAEHREPRERVDSARGVLIVDDHAGFRRCAHALLTEEGFDVVGEASSGVSALTLAAELEPDVVLLDIQLPDIDGFTVAERLLTDDPQLQIVLISSRDRSFYGPLIERSGACGFLCKADMSGLALERLLG